MPRKETLKKIFLEIFDKFFINWWHYLKLKKSSLETLKSVKQTIFSAQPRGLLRSLKFSWNFIIFSHHKTWTGMAPKGGSVVGLCHLSLILCEISYIDHYFCDTQPNPAAARRYSRLIVVGGARGFGFLARWCLCFGFASFLLVAWEGFGTHTDWWVMLSVCWRCTASDGGAAGFFSELETYDAGFKEKSVWFCVTQCNVLVLVLQISNKIDV